jgi:hypothetical protein
MRLAGWRLISTDITPADSGYNWHRYSMWWENPLI